MRKSILTLFLIALIVACGKDTEHPIPNVPVYIESPICLSDVEYFDLMNIYGKVLLKNEGYLGNGILLVNIGNYEFKAYDATCPHEIKEGCSVVADNSNILLVECTCCGSKYEITYGDVSNGPSNVPLKTYKTAFDGNCIRVYN